MQETTRRERVALTALLFLITSVFGFLQPFMSLYMETARVSREQIGLILGVGAALALLVQPILGRLSDRFDARRPFIATTALISGLAYFSYQFANQWWTYLLLTAAGINGTMYLNAAGGVLVGRMVTAARGGETYARYRVFGSIGYILIGILAGFLVRSQHLANTAYSRQELNVIFFWGPMLFVGIALIAAFVPDRKSAEPTLIAQKAPLPANLQWFLASYFFYILALYGSSTFLSLFMNELGGDALWVTGMFAGGVVVEVLVMLQAGRLSDRFGRRPILLICYLLLPVRMLLYVPATGPVWLAAVQLLHGINFGIMGVVSIALINDLSTNSTRGHAQGRLAAVAGVASAVGPVLFGWIAQHFGLRNTFAVAAGLATVAALIFSLRVQETLVQEA
ncbi:MAG: MFS transporter [Fimbriimonas sp.]